MDGAIAQGINVYLMNLSKEHFFGTVEVQFSDGEIILMRKTETIRPALLLIVKP